MARALLAGVFVLFLVSPAFARSDLVIAMSSGCFESDSILEIARRETVRIWSPAGLRVQWTTSVDLPYRLPASEWLVVRCVPRESGAVPASAPRGLPIAAIRFVNAVPTNTIAVSTEAARLLLDRDSIESRLLGERFRVLKELRLGRMIGRAIAHEIGHFLSASGEHTRSGLMRAVHPVRDLIGENLYPFRIENDFFARRTAGVLSGLVSGHADATPSSATGSCLGASAGVRVC
jgi:hypothetical protein